MPKMWVEDIDPSMPIGFKFAKVQEFGSTEMHGLDGAHNMHELDDAKGCELDDANVYELPGTGRYEVARHSNNYSGTTFLPCPVKSLPTSCDSHDHIPPGFSISC